MNSFNVGFRTKGMVGPGQQQASKAEDKRAFVRGKCKCTLFSLGTPPRSPAIDKHGNSTPPLVSFLVPKPDIFTKYF